MEPHRLPVYKLVEEGDGPANTYHVLTKAEHESLPEGLRDAFLSLGSVTHTEGDHWTIYLTAEKAAKTAITADVRVAVSSGSADKSDYLGLMSEFLSSAYKFTRKEKQPLPPTVSILSSSPHAQRIADLAYTRNQTREWANGRGDVEGTPQYFQAIAESFAKEN